MGFKNADEVLRLSFAVLIGTVTVLVVAMGVGVVLIGGCLILRGPAAEREEDTEPAELQIADEALEVTGSPISAQVMVKRFRQADFSAGEVDDSLEVAILFRNLGDRGLRAFRGQLLFADLFGDPLKLISFACDDEIPARESLAWICLVPYDPHSETDQQLRVKSLDNLQVGFAVTKVLYLDAPKWEVLEETSPEPGVVVSQAGVEGEFVSTDGEAVTMRLPDGKITTMSIDWLTAESQQRVRHLWASQSVDVGSLTPRLRISQEDSAP